MRILRQFERDGAIALESVSRAEFGVWDRIAPGWVMLAGLQIALRLRWESNTRTGEVIPAESVPEISSEEVTRIVSALRGDVSEAEEVVDRGLISLETVVRMLSFVTRAESMTDGELDRLFEYVEESCQEVLRLRSDESQFRTNSGGSDGPRDISEVDLSTVHLIDLGGLRIPSMAETDLQPMKAGGEVVAVTAAQGRTAIQLQAFRCIQGSSWESIRAQMMSRLQTQGSSVREWAGRAGIEIRAVVSATDAHGRSTVKNVRVLGADGPGWVLTSWNHQRSRCR
ncbi:DUF3710 domain-containing protein [Streptomyces formicae]|uniref:DUF3710 domain-containing protein n=1 Tax=Streptomyces formicae TaxID=1616117 RepID=A0ABY3WTI6_9ACTN|nr:DUF3710 domain-containing protein [Streptomyces formicae]UNM14970.1 DUF3710 domain-containing protein [Streptomyces formicae]